MSRSGPVQELDDVHGSNPEDCSDDSQDWFDAVNARFTEQARHQIDLQDQNNKLSLQVVALKKFNNNQENRISILEIENKAMLNRLKTVEDFVLKQQEFSHPRKRVRLNESGEMRLVQ